MTMRQSKFFCRSLLCGLVLAISAGATTIARMNLDELTRAAHVVARGKCLSSDARWDGGYIVTVNTFAVSESLKGSAQGQITVRLLGGKVGHMKATVDGVPQFERGDDVFLFLEPTREGDLSVTGWVQGAFRVQADPQTGKELVSQDSASFSVFDPSTRQFKPSGIRNMPIEEFRQRVRDSVNRQRTGK